MDIARGAAQHEFSLEPMRETAHYDQIRVYLSCMPAQRLARALRQNRLVIDYQHDCHIARPHEERKGIVHCPGRRTCGTPSNDNPLTCKFAHTLRYAVSAAGRYRTVHVA
jgi:hypothetical protein